MSMADQGVAPPVLLHSVPIVFESAGKSQPLTEPYGNGYNYTHSNSATASHNATAANCKIVRQPIANL
jgi:hypothetical protein